MRLEAKGWGRAWPRVRAALIALAVLVGLIDGLPGPKVGSRDLEHPLQRRELERWAGRLGSVGIETTPEALAAAVVSVGQAIARVQAVLLWPFEPLRRVTQVRQRWKLFPVANPGLYRMHVEARSANGDWELLYRPLDDEHRLLGDALEYRRVRGSWDPGMMGTRAGYPRVVDWLAGEVFRREPRFVEVRVRMQGVRVGARGGFTPTGAWASEVRRGRGGP